MKQQRPLITSLDGLGDEYVLTVNDIAATFNVDRTKVSEMLATGEIPGMFRVGKLLRICVKDVRAWIKSERLPKNMGIHLIREEARTASRRRSRQ